MTEEVKNEFEDLNADEAPEQTYSEVPSDGQDVISSGSAGITYDWANAPETAKAPPRVDLNGKTVVIKKADIIMPPVSRPWDKTRDKTKDVKYCQFILFYDQEGQQENYSGCRVFRRDDDKYSHPSVTKDGNNQVSKLLVAYAEFKKKDPNEVSLREFMGFLNSQPKAKITGISVTPPSTNEVIVKNMVECFVD